MQESPCCCPQLIVALDQAVQDGGVHAVAKKVESVLKEQIRRRELRMPAEMCEPVDGAYARRLVYRSPNLGYAVVAMVWGPGQRTPIHDHDGVWCVEGVVQGRIEVTQYDLLQHQGERYRFRAEGTVQAGIGGAGTLIPPFEYHTIANAQPETSVTIHVYGREMSTCRVFQPCGEGDWYQAATRSLAYNA